MWFCRCQSKFWATPCTMWCVGWHCLGQVASQQLQQLLDLSTHQGTLDKLGCRVLQGSSLD